MTVNDWLYRIVGISIVLPIPGVASCSKDEPTQPPAGNCVKTIGLPGIARRRHRPGGNAPMHVLAG